MTGLRKKRNYLDPPVWRRQVMIRGSNGHFYYGSTRGHLDVRTGSYHSLEPPYCACSSE